MITTLLLSSALAHTGACGTGSCSGVTGDTGAAASSPATSYPRPVAYWPLDEVDSVTAERAHGLEGVLVGTTDTQGPAGPALHFGPGAHADLGDHLSRMTAGDDARYSLSVWLRPDAAPGILWSKAADPSVCPVPAAQGELMVRLDGQGRVVVELFGDAGQRLRVRSTSALNPGTWSHLVVVQDATASAAEDRVRLFLDAAPWATDVLVARGGRFAVPDTDVPLALGGQLALGGVPCGARAFEGDLTAAAAFNVALDDASVEALHERTLAGLSLLDDDDPLDLLFLLDTSCSMAWGTPLTGQSGIDIAMEVAAQLVTIDPGPEDVVTAVTFGQLVSLWTPPTWVADDPQAILDQWSTFDQLTMTGATNHEGALAAARTLLAERADEGRFQAVVLITDGNPNPLNPTLWDEVDAVRAAGLHVWTIAFGSSINDATMFEYTQGFGTYEKTPDATGLAAVLEGILGSTP